MVTKFLHELVDRLGLISNKAIFFSNKKEKSVPDLTSEIQRKLALIKPDAYYSFNNQPYILFFDLSNEKDLEREDKIHKQVWSFDSAPVIFIIKKTDIEVYNSFYYQKEKKRLEKLLNNEEEIIERFSFWNIQSGEAWKWLQATKYKDTINKKRVNQRLFDNIREARIQLEENGLTPSDANTTILRLIFIRYLIDRGVGIKKEFISGETVLEKRKQLSELIQNTAKLSDFFEYLNKRFNGTLFKQKSSFRLKKEQASFLAEIFDSRKDKVTKTLFDNFYFDIFDFSIIPVEVISGIYESVIDDETKNNDSAVYTPPFLVEYILSETVDKYFKKNKISECKIFDPACGSGIFLVQSYRRMVDEELRKNKYVRIESARLREIAENNLFGIDLNEQALLVASFSIYIAILDYKEPKEINRFQFPNLIGKNLFKANFFDTNHEFNKVFQGIEFDFILGNPPWKNGSKDNIHVCYLKQNNLLSIVSNYQLAQSFILRSKDFIILKTRCVLLVTSKSFYNSNAEKFKNKFLTEFYLDKFFDLSAAREYVFNDAKNPGSIIFYRYAYKENTYRNIISYECVKPNLFLKHFNAIVVQKADRKEIQQGLFLTHSWMFKVALYGGLLDYNLLKKISNVDSIKNKLTNKKDEKWANLHYGDGIKRLTDTAKSKMKSKPAKFTQLKDIPVVETEEIKEYYTNVIADNLLPESDLFIKSGNDISLYIGERILLKARPRNESNIVVSYCDRDSIYREKTLGISTQIETSLLKSLFAYFISDLFTYYQYITSSSWGIYIPEILQTEFLNFPYYTITNDHEKKLTKLSNNIIQQIKQYRLSNFKSPSFPVLNKITKEINDIINNVYEINEVEKDLIDYILNVSRYEFQANKQDKLLKKIDSNTSFLENYAEVFFKELEGIYEGEYLQADVYPLDYFIAINFKMLAKKPSKSERIKIVYGVTDESKVLSILSTSLSIWDLTNSKNKEQNIFIQKDIKGYEKDSFYIIKPNEYKCWHRAMAWYDVAEIKAKFENAELEILNEKE